MCLYTQLKISLQRPISCYQVLGIRFSMTLTNKCTAHSAQQTNWLKRLHRMTDWLTVYECLSLSFSIHLSSAYIYTHTHTHKNKSPMSEGRKTEKSNHVPHKNTFPKKKNKSLWCTVQCALRVARNHLNFKWFSILPNSILAFSSFFLASWQKILVEATKTTDQRVTAKKKTIQKRKTT